jgi:glucose-6-phosphate isomerase
MPSSVIVGGPIEAAHRRLRDRAFSEAWTARLRARDPSVWTDDPRRVRSVEDRLGWIDAPARYAAEVPRLSAWAASVAEHHDAVVAVGMGGSSLAPEVLARTLAPSYRVTGRLRPALFVLDTTSPDALRALERRIDPARALYVVSSKSGTTIETARLSERLWDVEAHRTGGRAAAARRFVAVTDPGSPLAAEAKDRGYLRVFENDPKIGGRFSALSYFGLVPAALAGVDVVGLVERGRAACERFDEAADLGAFLAAAALGGRDKATLLFSEPLAPLGAWIEQLVAESTGKDGKGILPVDAEPVGDPSLHGAYGADRVFVATVLAGDASLDGLLAGLEAAGHPVARIEVPDALEIGGEFVRWEVATAVAGAALEVDPFDEPDVAAAKEATARVLSAFERDGAFPAGEAVEAPFTVARVHVDGARPPDYVAFQAFLPPSREIDEAFARIRRAVRGRLGVATTFGYGPRYLHSTGQIHKGGPPTGVFVQVTAEPAEDLPLPGLSYTLGALWAAQAAGDLEALRARGRRAIRVRLGRDIAAGLAALEAALI